MELKRSSSILFFSNFFLGLTPNLIPASNNALSVGRPLIIHLSFGSSGFSMKASVVKAAAFTIKNSLLLPAVALAKAGIILSTFIFPSVKVAVLSLQITEVLPNVSAATNFRTKPFLFKIRCIPRAKTTVIATGNPSGIEATATATDIVNISTKSPLISIPSIKIKKQITPIIIPIVFEKFASFF